VITPSEEEPFPGSAAIVTRRRARLQGPAKFLQGRNGGPQKREKKKKLFFSSLFFFFFFR
jgi:hypothetical protein